MLNFNMLYIQHIKITAIDYISPNIVGSAPGPQPEHYVWGSQISSGGLGGEDGKLY